MRVLFLDIDGVLNSSRSCAAFGGYPHGFGSDDMRKFDAIALGLIQRLCRAVPDLRIILSSTWRRDRAPMEAGLALRLPIIDSTPVLNGKRGDEIAQAQAVANSSGEMVEVYTADGIVAASVTPDR